MLACRRGNLYAYAMATKLTPQEAQLVLSLIDHAAASRLPDPAWQDWRKAHDKLVVMAHGTER